MNTYRLHPVTRAVFVLGFIWIIATRQLQPEVPTVRADEVLPVVTLRSLTGQSVSTDTLRGRPAMLTLWASWCPPCVAEMPLLAEMQPWLAERGIVFVAINQGESTTTVTEYLQSHGYTFAVWSDTQSQMGNVVRSNDLPTTVFVDANGVVRLVYRGPVTAALIRVMADVLTTTIGARS
jgi:thiol-disulfide isomerase/thioredoxin